MKTSATTILQGCNIQWPTQQCTEHTKVVWNTIPVDIVVLQLIEDGWKYCDVLIQIQIYFDCLSAQMCGME